MLETNKPQRFNAYDQPHADLREFIDLAESAGELLRIKGADWDLEMGTLTEIIYHAKAVRRGAPYIIVNQGPTDHDDRGQLLHRHDRGLARTVRGVPRRAGR